MVKYRSTYCSTAGDNEMWTFFWSLGKQVIKKKVIIYQLSVCNSNTASQSYLSSADLHEIEVRCSRYILDI